MSKVKLFALTYSVLIIARARSKVKSKTVENF